MTKKSKIKMNSYSTRIVLFLPANVFVTLCGYLNWPIHNRIQRNICRITTLHRTFVWQLANLIQYIFLYRFHRKCKSSENQSVDKMTRKMRIISMLFDTAWRNFYVFFHYISNQESLAPLFIVHCPCPFTPKCRLNNSGCIRHDICLWHCHQICIKNNF